VTAGRPPSPALVILNADVRSAWNRLRRGGGEGRRSVLAFLVSSVVLGPLVLVLALASGLALGRIGADPVGSLTGGFAALVVLITGLGVSTVIQSFFADRALLLFALAPVRPRDVFLARLLTCSLPAWLVGLGVVALITGYGIARGAGATYYLAGLVAVGLTVFSTVSVLVAVLSLVLRVVPARRARDVASLAAALIGAGIYVGWYGVVGGGQGRYSLETFQRATALGSQLGWLPIAWPARALAAWAAGDAGGAAAWFGVTLAGALLAIGLAWLGYRQAFLVGVGVYGEVGAQSAGRRGRRSGAPRSLSRRAPAAVGRPRPALALAAKDLRSLRRDIKRLASVLPAVAMAIAYPLIFFRVPARSGEIGFWVGMLSGAFAPFLLSTALALPAVGIEGRGVQLLLLAGVRATVIVRAKLAYALPIIIVLGTGGGVVGALARPAPTGEKLAAVLAVAWIAAGMAAIGVGAGAAAPNFEASNPQRAIHFHAGLLALAADVAFALLSCGAVLLLVISRLLPPDTRRLLALAAVLPATAAAGVVAGVLTYGTRRLARWTPVDR
jgi:ABC-2 type transport system permease protein